MRALPILVRRELGVFFICWTGYVVIAAVLFVIGLSFVGIIQALNNDSISFSITELFYETITFWLILLITSPVITMRMYAQEKQTGTFETLMTAPISDLEVVLAKFLGALLFYCLMWLPLFGLVFALRQYTNEPTALDLGALATTILGIFLLGMLYMALGNLASALTRSQMIAAIVSFVGGLSLFLAGYLAYAVPPQLGWTHLALSHINMFQHMEDFARGIVDTRAVVFYVTATFLLLFLTLRAVESRRWQ